MPLARRPAYRYRICCVSRTRLLRIFLWASSSGANSTSRRPIFPFITCLSIVRRRQTSGSSGTYTIQSLRTVMCGGPVIDDRLYRRMPVSHRQAIRNSGGIAEHLLKITFARLEHAAAIWGYVGDTRAERVDERVGFRRTDHPCMMVCWMRELSDADKRARLSRGWRSARFEFCLAVTSPMPEGAGLNRAAPQAISGRPIAGRPDSCRTSARPSWRSVRATGSSRARAGPRAVRCSRQAARR